MFTIDSIVLYVQDLDASMTFYADTFECEPRKLSPTFALVEFAGNVAITLKQSDSLEPSSDVKGGGTELSIPATDSETFNKLFETWKGKGVQFAQEVESSVYGYNFVALDPDNHRIRVFTH